jgi:hypothetical protein
MTVHTVSTSTCVSKLSWLLTPSSHHHRLKVHLQTSLSMASKCLSNDASLQPPNVSLSSVNLHLKVHLGVHLSTIRTQIDCRNICRLWKTIHHTVWWPWIILQL